MNVRMVGLKSAVLRDIINPLLEQVSNNVRDDISNIAEQFRGVRSPSIADKGGTIHYITKYRSRIMPVQGTMHTFLINRDGYDDARFFNRSDAMVEAWVQKKIPNYDDEYLRVRGKRETGGISTPLGSADRDMFGIAFKNLIGRDRRKYRLK